MWFPSEKEIKKILSEFREALANLKKDHEKIQEQLNNIDKIIKTNQIVVMEMLVNIYDLLPKPYNRPDKKKQVE